MNAQCLHKTTIRSTQPGNTTHLSTLPCSAWVLLTRGVKTGGPFGR
jgi:hypothetical protein